MRENRNTVLRLSWWADFLRGVSILSVMALSILRGLLCVLALSSERRDPAACESLAPIEAAPRLSPIDQGFVCSWIERTFDAYKCMRDADSVRPPPRGENALFSSSARQLPSSPCTRITFNSPSAHLTRLPGRTRQVETCWLKRISLFTTRGLNEVRPVPLDRGRVKRLCSSLRLDPGYRLWARIQQLVTAAGIQQVVWRAHSSVAAADT